MIIHRDLKPENILVDDQGVLKLSDFGICTFINLETQSISRTKYAGTPRFMAPEILNESKIYDEKVDVYSFGVVIYWLLTKGKYPDVICVEVANGKQAEIPESLGQFAKDLINKCWKYSPNERPSFDEICEILKNKRQE